VREWGAFVPEELPPAQEAGEWNEAPGGPPGKGGKDNRKAQRP